MIARRALLAGAAALAAPGRARAERPLALIVGAAPGSKADQVVRAFSPFLERHWPGTVVRIRNAPGDAGAAAYRIAAAAAPDGALLGWAATPSLPARSVDHADGSLLDRLRLLGAVQREPVTYVFSADSALGSAQELVDRVAAGRQGLPLATPPAGSAPHLAALQLQAKAGLPLAIVAFPSAAAARHAVLSANAGAAALGLGDGVLGLRDGRLAGLVAWRDGSAEIPPDLPLRQDADLPRVLTEIRRGLAAPARLPPALAQGLADAMQSVVADPEFVAQAEAAGFIAEWRSAAAWTAIADDERASLNGLWRSAAWMSVGAG